LSAWRPHPGLWRHSKSSSSSMLRNQRSNFPLLSGLRWTVS